MFAVVLTRHPKLFWRAGMTMITSVAISVLCVLYINLHQIPYTVRSFYELQMAMCMGISSFG